MNHTRTFGVLGFALLGLGVLACSSKGLSDYRDGKYEHEALSYNTCLYANSNASQLTPDMACDLENRGIGYSYQILGGDEAGTDQDGRPCGFDFAHEDPVPVDGNSFAIDAAPAGSAEQYSVRGMLDRDRASGTTSKSSGISRCDIEWTATHSNGGTGGVGGDGGAGGDSGSGGAGGEDPITGLDEIPDCTEGEPHDFADGTFGSGWVDSYAQQVPESDYETHQAEEGGNPGRYYSIFLTTGSSMVGTSTCVLSLSENGRYDPAEMGAYTNIVLRLQASTPGSEHSSLQTRFSVAVKQGDDLYWAGPKSIMIKFIDGWTDHQIDESQLHVFPSYTEQQAPDPNGEALSFGFITCVNGERYDSAVDNFIVRVCDSEAP